jgi:hypothetical protein
MKGYFSLLVRDWLIANLALLPIPVSDLSVSRFAEDWGVGVGLSLANELNAMKVKSHGRFPCNRPVLIRNGAQINHPLFSVRAIALCYEYYCIAFE